MATNGNGHPFIDDDPMDAASNATLAPRAYYGQIQVDTYFCVLIKGTGKAVFDSNQHNRDDRRTAVDISLLPLPEQNVRFELRREIIAESREWAGIVWPSLKALGLTNLRDANGKWAKMQQVPSGRTYEAKRGARAGQQVESTTFKFLALYTDEDNCRAAYLADTGKSVADTSAQTPTTPPPGFNGGNGHSPTFALAKAKPFIAAFAKMNDYDLAKTAEACRGQKLITDAIDLESPEFAEIVAEAMSAAQGGK